MNNRKGASITGAAGHGGARPAQLLLDKGYVLQGMKRWSSSFVREARGA